VGKGGGRSALEGRRRRFARGLVVRNNDAGVHARRNNDKKCTAKTDIVNIHARDRVTQREV